MSLLRTTIIHSSLLFISSVLCQCRKKCEKIKNSTRVIVQTNSDALASLVQFVWSGVKAVKWTKLYCTQSNYFVKLLQWNSKHEVSRLKTRLLGEKQNFVTMTMHEFWDTVILSQQHFAGEPVFVLGAIFFLLLVVLHLVVVSVVVLHNFVLVTGRAQELNILQICQLLYNLIWVAGCFLLIQNICIRHL